MDPRGKAQRTRRFAEKLASSFSARDRVAAASLYSDDAFLSLVGEREDARGRVAIERSFGRLFEAYSSASLSVGRMWVNARASVVELAFGGQSTGGASTGVVGACVVTFGDDGLVKESRVYVDVPTYLAEVEPGRLPACMKVRPLTSSCPAGHDVLESGDSPAEARNLAISDGVWAALEAHQAEEAVAPMAEDYVYEDFAGPAALTKEGTRQLVLDFLGALRDFKVAQPVRFAAGDDVVVETSEVAIFRDSPPDRPVALHGITVMRFRAGQVVRQWQYANGHELLVELGRMPPREP